MTGETKTEKAGTEDAPNKDEAQGNATVRLPHYVRNSVIGVVCAVAFAAAIEVAFVVLLNSPFYSHVDDDASADSGVQQETVVHVDEEGLPKLTDWEQFGNYWQEATAKLATYAEKDESGDEHYYALREGYMSGGEITDLAILQGSSQTTQDQDWSIVIVDCSTGALSWWSPSEELTAKLDGSTNSEFLEVNGLVPYEGKWLMYANPPQATGDIIIDTGMGTVTPEQEKEHDDAYHAELLEMFGSLDEEQRQLHIDQVQDDEETIDALIERYGEKEIMKYMDVAERSK